MIRVKDLKNQVGEKGPRPILYCRICGDESSANADDYWYLPATQAFRCCELNMVRAIKSTHYEIA